MKRWQFSQETPESQIFGGQGAILGKQDQNLALSCWSTDNAKYLHQVWSELL